MARKSSSLIGIAGLTALFALCGCAGAGAGRPALVPHVAEPGYSCDVGDGSGLGARAHATLDASGQQRSARWDWRRNSGTSLLRFGASGSVEGPAPLGIADAYAVVQWAVPLPRGHVPRWRLELHSMPESRYIWGTGFIGGYEVTGDHALMTGWTDLIAFARGAPKLVVILRDMRGEVVQRAEVDPAILVGGEAEVAAVLDQLAAMTADFRTRCEPADINESDIVVT